MFQFPPSPTPGQTFTPSAGITFRWNGTAWYLISGQVLQSIPIACSDEITALTTGLRVTFRMPIGMTLVRIKASLTTASTSGLVTVDVKRGGTSLFSTLLTIDANEKTSVTAAIPAVLAATALADDDELEIYATTAGTGAKGLKVYPVGAQA